MAANYNELASASGTRVYITTKAPASHDAAGFNAIPDSATHTGADGFEEIGFVTDLGAIPRPKRSYEDKTTLSGITYKIAQSPKMEDTEMKALLQPANKGQSILEAVGDGVTICWFKTVTPSGRKKYWASYVTGVGDVIEGVEGAMSLAWTSVPLFDANGTGSVTG